MYQFFLLIQMWSEVSHSPSHKVAQTANLYYIRTGLVLDFQYGGIVVQYSQDYLIHVLPEPEVDFLLFLQSLDQLQDKKIMSTKMSSNKTRHTTKGSHFLKRQMMVRSIWFCFRLCLFRSIKTYSEHQKTTSKNLIQSFHYKL